MVENLTLRRAQIIDTSVINAKETMSAFSGITTEPIFIRYSFSWQSCYFSKTTAYEINADTASKILIKETVLL